MVRITSKKSRACGVWIVLLVALFAAGCSTDLDLASDTTSPPTVSRPTSSVVSAERSVEVVAVTESIVDLAGGDSSFASAAMLMAVDRGYVFEVVRVAVLSDNFSLDGIVWADGVAVTPSGADVGFITDKSEFPSEELSFGDGTDVGVEVTLASFAAPAQELGLSLDGLFTALDNADLTPPEEVGVDMTAWENRRPQDKDAYGQTAVIAMLLHLGFSADQIINYVIYNEYLTCDDFASRQANCTLDGVPPEFGFGRPEETSGDVEEQAEADVEAEPGEPAPDESEPEGSSYMFYNGSFGLRTEPLVDFDPGLGAAIELLEDVFVVEIDNGIVTLADGHASWNTPLRPSENGSTCPGENDLVMTGDLSTVTYTDTGFEFEVLVSWWFAVLDCDTFETVYDGTSVDVETAVATISGQSMSIAIPVRIFEGYSSITAELTSE